MTYSSSLEASLALYQEARYREAYDLISSEVSSPDTIPSLVYYLRYSFACRAGMHELAIDLLREAVMDRGYWYSTDHLTDDDLEPLRGRPEFRELVEICQRREETARGTVCSELELVPPGEPGNGEHTALVVALHGNQLNIATTRTNWSGNSLADCLLAFPQSSHAVCSDAYSWVDPAVGMEEVMSHLEDVISKNLSDRDRVIMGGFSAGGRVALHTVLKGRVRIKGVILLGPWLPDLESLEPLIPSLRKAGVKFYLICGDRDKDCFASTNRLAELLELNDVPFIYRVVEGMGHQYPKDFDEYLAQARSFILDEQVE
jgi:predicted esterase